MHLILFEEPGREVAFAGVRQERDDRLSGELRAFGKFERGPERSSGGDTNEESLLRSRRTRRSARVIRRDLHDFVQERHIEYFRDEARADALDLVRARLSTERTGEVSGSTANSFTSGFFSLR